MTPLRRSTMGRSRGAGLEVGGATRKTRPRRATRFRAALILVLAIALARGGWPVARDALVAFEVDRARRALADAEPEQASDRLEAAERLAPNRPEIQYLLAIGCRRQGAYRAAEEHLVRAEALGWSKLDLERQRMMLLFQRGYFAESEGYLTAVLEQGAEGELAEDVYETLVTGYMAERRLHEASGWLRYWTRSRPDSVRAKLLLAAMFWQTMNAPNLQAELREILQVRPRRLNDRLALVQSLLESGELEPAAAQVEICLRQAPRDPRVRLALGLCRQRQGRLDEAQRELEAVLADGLEGLASAQAHTALAQMASAARDFDSALRHYQQAVAISPYDPSPSYGLGVTLRLLGREEEAQEQVRRSKLLQETSARLADIEEQLREDNTNVPLRVEAANILRGQGRKTEAANWMMSALHCEPRLRVAHELLADYCQERGAAEQARRHREAAQQGVEVVGTQIQTSGPR